MTKTKKVTTDGVNRTQRDWESIKTSFKKKNAEKIIFDRLKELITSRKETLAFADNNNLVLHHSNNPHLFVFERPSEQGKGILAIVNFDEKHQPLDAILVQQLGYSKSNMAFDLVSDKRKSLRKGCLMIAPYQLLWLEQMD